MSEKTISTTKVEYDPKKVYSWQPEDTFSLDGREFGVLLQYLMKKRPELMMEVELLSILELKLKKAVEEGVAVEMVQEVKEQ